MFAYFIIPVSIKIVLVWICFHTVIFKSCQQYFRCFLKFDILTCEICCIDIHLGCSVRIRYKQNKLHKNILNNNGPRIEPYWTPNKFLTTCCNCCSIQLFPLHIIGIAFNFVNSVQPSGRFSSCLLITSSSINMSPWVAVRTCQLD